MGTKVSFGRTQDVQLSQLISALERASEQLPTTLPKAWFSESLFHCRSERPVDYLAEIEHNLNKLAQMAAEAPGFSYLSEHTEAQLIAYTQAIYRAKRPRSGYPKSDLHQSRDMPEGRANQRAKLEQELARHLEYERRLQDNLRDAQGANNDARNQALVLKCQQRLLRCQRAIADIEKRLEQAG